METIGTKTRTEMEANLNRLRRLRDEVRLNAHLATMEAKEHWRQLEPHVNALVDQAEKSAAAMSREVVTDAIDKLQKLRDRI